MKSGEPHVPLRTCVVCGNRRPKVELMRIVATPQGSVEVDSAGKLPGRGAYVCADGSCAQGSLRRSRVEYTLRTGLKDDEWTTVMSSVEAMKPPC